MVMLVGHYEGPNQLTANTHTVQHRVSVARTAYLRDERNTYSLYCLLN